MIIKSCDLRPWCEENIGPMWKTWDWWWIDEDYRLRFPNKIKIELEFGYAKKNMPAVVSFKNEEDLMLFKLRWL